MTTLVITRGLPAAGKTTLAKRWVEGDREHRARVNRDDIRQMLDEGEFIKGVTEPRVLAVRDAVIFNLLKKGVDVICDDTNLPQRVARDLAGIAKRASADFEVIDLTDVPLNVCLCHNAGRTDKDPVPEYVIYDMHKRFIAGKEFPLPLPEEPVEAQTDLVPYVPVPGTPKAVLVDIDGTVALHGDRDPFDATRVREDRPNEPVIAVVRSLMVAGYEVRYCSGRTDACRDATVDWLREHVMSSTLPTDLYMRAAGDGRKDSIVKLELFDKHIRHSYNIICVLDDRASVVAAWRSIGLTVLAVAEGNF